MRQWVSVTLAFVLLASIAASRPTVALAGSGPVTPPAPICPNVKTVADVGSSLNNLTPVHAQSDITCAVPSGLTGQPDGPGGPGPARTFPPAGTPCEVVRDEPEALVVNPNGTATEMVPDPNGRLTPFNGWGQYSIIIIDEFAGAQVYFPWEHPGQFDTAGNCVPTAAGQWDNGCAGPVKTDPLISLTGLSSNQCLHIVTDAAVGTGLPGPVIQPELIKLRGQVDGLITAGTMSSLPLPAGLVNYPTCFFVSNMNTPQDQQFQIVIAGPADALRRHIFYVFVITVTNDGISWDFGDGSGDTTGVALPPQCTAQAGAAQVSTAHVYTHYSDGQPGGAFQVRAVEHYSISATEMWVNGDGHPAQAVQVDLAALGVPATIDKPVPAGGAAYPQPILQEEGVPVGG